MSDFHKKTALTVGALFLILSALFSSQKGADRNDNAPASESWMKGVPKLLVVDETASRGVHQAMAINSTLWREPFEKQGGQYVHYDPANDEGGENAITLGKDYPWFPLALRRADQSKKPYFVYASQGKVSVGHVKNTPEGCDEFIDKLKSRLTK